MEMPDWAFGLLVLVLVVGLFVGARLVLAGGRRGGRAQASERSRTGGYGTPGAPGPGL
jgi:hypothetical protein